MATETFTLSRPLKTHSGELLALTLQEPTCRAFVEYGEPFKVVPIKGEDGSAEGVSFVYDNNKALMRWLSDMVVEKGVDEIVLKGMTASDFYQLRGMATNIILLGVSDKNFTAPSAD